MRLVRLWMRVSCRRYRYVWRVELTVRVDQVKRGFRKSGSRAAQRAGKVSERSRQNWRDQESRVDSEGIKENSPKRAGDDSRGRGESAPKSPVVYGRQGFRSTGLDHSPVELRTGSDVEVEGPRRVERKRVWC